MSLSRTQGKDGGVFRSGILKALAGAKDPARDVAFWFLQLFYRIHGTLREASARIRGKAFYCTALANTSSVPRLIINSDLSVSCTPGDQTGEGQIGNLGTHSIEEVLHGQKATLFRTLLSKGRLPIFRCTRCDVLRTVPRGSLTPEQEPANKRRVFRQVSIETTANCNYRCRGCMREQIYANRTIRSMSEIHLGKVADRLKGYEVPSIGLHVRGEPSLAKDFAQQLYAIREFLPASGLHFSTNGWGIDSDEKRQAIMDCVQELEFSIDGIDQDMAARYQIGMDFERVTKNLKDLVDYRNRQGLQRPEINWKYVLFKWNDRFSDIEKLVDLARAAGVDSVMLFPAMTPLFAMPFRYWLRKKKYIKRWSLTQANPQGEMRINLQGSKERVCLEHGEFCSCP